MSTSPENILKRLEELRVWQEEQQRILLEKQVSQREVLNLEKRKLYEKFGLSTTSSLDASFVSNNNTANDQIIENDLEGIQELPLSECESENGNNASTKGHDSSEDIPQTYRVNSPNEKQSSGPTVPSKPFLRRGQGLSNRFKINPDNLRLSNLPKYKFANAHKKSKFFKKTLKSVKFDERSNVKSNSETTPDDCAAKIEKSTRQSTGKPLVQSKKISSELRLKPSTSGIQVSQKTLQKSTTAKEHLQRQTISWNNILDPSNIQPILVNPLSSTELQDTPTREKVQQQQREIDEMNVFELLERNMDRSDASVFQQFLNRPQTIPEHSLVDRLAVPKKTIQPFPFDIPKTITIDDPSSDSETSHVDCNDESELRHKNSKQCVRFSDDVVINEDDIAASECETIISTDADDIDLSKISTPNTKKAFAAFRAKIFAENIATEDGQSLVNTNLIQGTSNKEIQEKVELLKTRLKDLEQETEMFRQQNIALTKMKQQHELEKLSLEEERTEMNDKLSDERIKMEVYLHDERMKIAEEQQKLEKRAKELRGPNRKEREEVAKLKQQVSDLQKELSAKDQKHVAAQARLRSQIRTMEKDLKDQGFELENLRKENKKIESENIRLRRQGSNKLLQEINKNIAKLAPNVQSNETIEKTESKKENNKGHVVAKVISHRNSTDKITKIHSKSVPNLSQQSKSIEKSQILGFDDESDELSDSASDENETLKSVYFTNETKQRKQLQTEKEAKAVRNDSNLRLTGNDSDSKGLKREIQNEDGSKDVWYPNGNLKKISADSMTIRMLYFNKDIKETNIHEGTVKYYYADTNTWHTTYLDGLEILEFPNGQTEHRYKDGSVEIHFPNGSIRISNPNNVDIAEEWKFPDGTTVVQKRDGDKLLKLPNGQREVHTKRHKRREYPDGTVKLVYPDGSQETRYSNGRIRLKDSTGNLVMDSENAFAEN